MTAIVYGSLGLCFALGVFLFAIGARNIWRAFASASWPTAPAVVVSSNRKVTRSSKGSPTVEAEVIARYNVNGREYTTANQKFGQIFGSSDTSVAELQSLRYPPGAAISVAYHPSEPSLATIEPGFGIGALLGPFAGIALMLVAVMFAVLYRSSGSSSGMAFGVSLFAAIFMALGSAMLLVGGVNLYRAYVSTGWPTAKGEIVFDDVDATTSTATERGSTRSSTTYGARIIFKYEAGGKVRYSNTRRFGELAGSDQEWANAIADKYPSGIKLNVYYDPADPDLAILEPGIESEAYWIPGAGLAFFLFGLAAVLIVVPQLKDF